MCNIDIYLMSHSSWSSVYLMSHSRATPLMVQCLGPMSLSKSIDPM